MKIIKTVDEFLDWRSKINLSLGFVPTMGALHKGHLSLIEQSKKNCNLSVVSIFINPTQFAENEDIDSYPQTLNYDIDCLKKLKVDILFLPSENEMYKRVPDVNVPQSDLFIKLEGASRPHFFFGVTQIVAKLFNVIKPTHTFFGEKDAQQLIIIKEMIKKMNYPIKLIPGPTIRDDRGLALSSRNQYLTKNEKTEASIFYSSLLNIKNLIEEGEKNCEKLKNSFKENIKKFKKIKIDYISIVSKNTLEELITVKGTILISSAIFYNNVRLIDNITYQSST